MKKIVPFLAGVLCLFASLANAEDLNIITITSDDIILNEPQFTDYVNNKMPFFADRLINLAKDQPYKRLNVDFKSFDQFMKTVNEFYFLQKTFQENIENWEKEADGIREEIFQLESIGSSTGIKTVLDYKFLKKNIKYSIKNLDVIEDDFNTLFKLLISSDISAPEAEVKDLRTYTAHMVNRFQGLKAEKVSFGDFDDDGSEKAGEIENAKDLYGYFLQAARNMTGSFHLKSEMIEKKDSAIQLVKDMLNYELYVSNNKKITVVRLARTVGYAILLILVYFALKYLFNASLKEKSVSYAINTLSKYGFVIATLVITLHGFGLDLSNITLLVSALSVGIGFGLTTIVSNFVSGILLLMEHTIKIGDKLILQNGTTATVAAIGLRKSILTTIDNVDVAIPNTELVSKEVVNLTHARNPVSRHRIKFSVNPAIDLKKMEEIALESVVNTLGGKEKVVQEEPRLLISQLNAAELECELWVYLDNLNNAVPDGLIKKNLMNDLLNAKLDIFTAPVQLVEMVDPGSKLSCKEAHKSTRTKS